MQLLTQNRESCQKIRFVSCCGHSSTTKAMPIDNLVVVTGNKGKAAEIGSILGLDVEAIPLDILEIQSLSVEEVALKKVEAAFEQLKRPVIVDDTGMTIEALNGLPGALVAWFLDGVGPEGILNMIAHNFDRRASVSTCIGYADENGARTFTGTIHGNLTYKLTGENGFGYDPIFVPEGYNQTYAQMSQEEKNQVSMRKLALDQLKEHLQSLS